MIVTIKETLHNINADYKRAALLLGRERGILNQLYVLIQPGVVLALCYRLARYCYYNKLGFMCRVFDAIAFFYSTSEIAPQADLGPGLVFDGKFFGIPSAVTMGKNCTLLGRNTITLGAMENFSLERDRINIGDHCVFGHGSRVIRPITLEAGAQVAPNSVVMFAETRPGSTVSGIPAKRRRVDDLDAIKAWSPILCKKLVVE